MKEKELKCYQEAGRIAAETLVYGASLIKKNTYLLDVIEKLEHHITQKAEMAFPPQISLNNVAAHFYPDHHDEIVFEEQVAKLDVGVHVDGFIGDTACTVDLSGKHGELVQASREALDNALAIVKHGVTIGEIGAVIQDTITKYGLAPVRNLSGHGLADFDVHAWPSIPNTATGDKTQLEEGWVVAIEPFASTGAGIVVETSNATLFQLLDVKPVRDHTTREVLKFIENFGDLPFAKRWLVEDFPVFKVNFALKRLLHFEIIKEFPPLADKAKGIVSQAEHTVLVEKDGCKVLTKE
ncbi:type II methionyl aminopeptidase [Candidatus Woesearchaeota archaeon]|nr:type II methionyl aminopeptidase [Candidatus Woesearchaeota archaeon]